VAPHNFADSNRLRSACRVLSTETGTGTPREFRPEFQIVFRVPDHFMSLLIRHESSSHGVPPRATLPAIKL